jgi:hypothetical protein
MPIVKRSDLRIFAVAFRFGLFDFLIFFSLAGLL